jgi:hypothetical protein
MVDETRIRLTRGREAAAGRLETKAAQPHVEAFAVQSASDEMFPDL